MTKKFFPIKTSESQTEFMKKFAELIIKETLEVVRDEVQYALDDYLADTIDIRVKNHFLLVLLTFHLCLSFSYLLLN